MKKPVGPKARPSLKNCKPEPGPGPIVKVQARARPARGKKLKPEPEKSQARHITILPVEYCPTNITVGLASKSGSARAGE